MISLTGIYCEQGPCFSTVIWLNGGKSIDKMQINVVQYIKWFFIMWRCNQDFIHGYVLLHWLKPYSSNQVIEQELNVWIPGFILINKRPSIW